METPHFSPSEVQILYEGSNEKGKSLLEKKYGEDFFSDKTWTENFDEFCKDNNLIITQDARKARTEPGYTYLPHAVPEGPEEEHDNASRMIRTMLAHRNKKLGFKANPKDKKQRRYFPIFEWTETGLVFSGTSCEDWDSGSDAFVGAPFTSPTSDDAAAFAKENLPIYVKLLQ